MQINRELSNPLKLSTAKALHYMIFLIFEDNNYYRILLIFMKPQKYLSLKLYDMIVCKILIVYHLKFIHKT